jgi:GxxExxY protein
MQVQVRKANPGPLQGLEHPWSEIDLLLEELVLVEIKAVPAVLEVHERQVRSYLKTLELRAGLLVNFNTALLKNGLRRVVRT